MNVTAPECVKPAYEISNRNTRSSIESARVTESDFVNRVANSTTVTPDSRAVEAAPVTDTDFVVRPTDSPAVTFRKLLHLITNRLPLPTDGPEMQAVWESLTPYQRKRLTWARMCRATECPNCGTKFIGQRAHYEASPACWEAEQEKRAASYNGRWGVQRYYCWDCERPIYSRRPVGLCVHCLKARKATRQKERRAASKIAEVKCDVCGEAFVPRRADAVTCSAKCRQKKYRTTKAAGSQTVQQEGAE